MKKNNKGFVLAEAIIVSVFVLGMFTYLAMNVIPLISRYERVVNYDNPQEIYLANTLYEEMLNVEDINSDSDIELSIENTNNGTEEEPNLTCTRKGACTGSDDFYTKLGKALKIEAIYTYDTTNPNKNCKSISNDKGLKKEVCISEREWYNNGFMTGICGIGYELLYQENSDLPDVLRLKIE